MKNLPALEQEPLTSDAHMHVQVVDSLGHYFETRDGAGQPIHHGQFNVSLAVSAQQGTVYVPTSLASSKKATGFVYHIEGTGEGNIATASLSCSGKEVSQITLGTLEYTRIPQGKTARFDLVISIEGSWGNMYRIVINRINYKLDPTDARYKKLSTQIGSTELLFK